MSRSADFQTALHGLRHFDGTSLGFDEYESESMVENPMKYDDSVFNVVDSSDRYKHGASKVTDESLHPKDLHATQAWVDHGMTEDYAGSPSKRPVDVVRLNGRNFVMDGHHRAAAALLTDRPVRAKVYHWD